MAFTVEDGTGLAAANAYISIATADTYHEDRGNADWTDASPEDKEQAIVRASDYLDQNYRWQGDILVEGQGLEWPRDAVFDEDGFEVASDAVPSQIERACAELALAALCLDLDPDADGTGASQESKTAGGMSIQRTLANNQPVFHRAAKLVCELTAGDGLRRT